MMSDEHRGELGRLCRAVADGGDPRPLFQFMLDLPMREWPDVDPWRNLGASEQSPAAVEPAPVSLAEACHVIDTA